MSVEKRVLFKSRGQRLAEAVIQLPITLSVGPVLRSALGDAYMFSYGLVAAIGVLVAMASISNRLAGHFGGEWLTRTERLQRLLAEGAATRWQTAAINMVMVAGSVLGLLMIIFPLNELPDGIGGMPTLIGLIAVPTLVAGVPCLAIRRGTPLPVVADLPAAESHVRVWLLRALPQTIIAYFIGSAIVVLLARQFPHIAEFVPLNVVLLAFSELIRQFLWWRKRPTQVIPATPLRFWNQAVAGIVLFGIPMGFVVGTFAILETQGLLRVVSIAGAIAVSLISGVAWGALMGVLQRIADPERRAGRS